MCSKSKPYVLIIDDEKRFATMLSKRLSLRGYLCEVVYDGETGLEMLPRHPFKVVVLDLRLPGLSGEEVLERIKIEQPDLPVIILTGHGNEKERQVCMGLKAHSFLNKPVDLSNLVDLFETIIGPEDQQPESVIES
jgi:DNA-binding NtrC family response regulator